MYFINFIYRITGYSPFDTSTISTLKNSLIAQLVKFFWLVN